MKLTQRKENRLLNAISIVAFIIISLIGVVFMVSLLYHLLAK